MSTRLFGWRRARIASVRHAMIAFGVGAVVWSLAVPVSGQGQGRGANRVIPLDGRPHVGPNVKLWMGDGRGRWEGNTLVVDTTNLNAKFRLSVVGDFFSDKAHVVERLTFIDANTMSYEATIDDPTVFTRPWTLRVATRRGPDEEIWEWACPEGERSLARMSLQMDKEEK